MSRRMMTDETNRIEASRRRSNAEHFSRLAEPPTGAVGFRLGVTQATLSHGGTVSVALMYWSTTSNSWVQSDKTLTARDFFLGSGEELDSGTRVQIDWYINTWVVTQAACSPDSGGGGGGGGGGASTSGAHLGIGSGFGTGYGEADNFYPGGMDSSLADLYSQSERDYDSLFAL